MAQHDGDDDHRQIAALLDRYIDGARSGRSADMHELFHAQSTICGYVGPDLFAGPIRMFYDWHDGNGPATGIRVTDTRIDVEGSAASARIDIDDWTGHRFTDYFTLVRIDGTWRILGKVFHLHDG